MMSNFYEGRREMSMDGEVTRCKKGGESAIRITIRDLDSLEVNLLLLIFRSLTTISSKGKNTKN